MLDFLKQLVGQFKEVWTKLNLVQRSVLVGIPALVLVLFMMMLANSWKQEYAVLYSELAPQEASKIREKLVSSGVSYRLGSGGGTILVPQKDVYEARLSLAAEGLPLFGSVGMEIFDVQKFGITERQETINYQRAIQGELERTISAIEGIQKVRVHVVLPEPRLYSDQQNPTTASVVLSLRPPDRRLTVENVRTVAYILSASIEGLHPQNVKISDNRGRLLSDMLAGTWEENNLTPLARQPGVVESKLRMEWEAGNKIEKAVETMLARVLGPDRAVARATVELNFDSKTQEAEIFEPVVGDNLGILRSQTQKTENYVMDGSVVSGVPGGVPGVESNMPVYQEGDLGAAQFNRNETILNYEVTRRVEKLESAPGRIQRISLTVIVDNVQPQQLAAIESASREAAGIDEVRGDRLTVENIPFDTSLIQEERRAMDLESTQEFWYTLMKGGLILSIALFLLLFLRSILRPRVIREVAGPLIVVPPPFEAEPPLDLRLEPEPDVLPEPEPEPEPEIDTEPIITEETTEAELEAIRRRKELERKRKVRDEVERIAGSKPENIANLVRRWLTEED